MLHLNIITPDRITFSDDVTMVTVPGTEGEMGILPRHQSIFAQLTEGEIKIQQGSKEEYLAIGGGFIEVHNNTVDILVTRAVYADELNEQEILKAQEQAKKALESDVSDLERHHAQQLFRRSLVDLKILRRRKQSH